MKPAVSLAAAIAVVSACAGTIRPDDALGGIVDELPGTCVDPGGPTTRVTIHAIDRNAAMFCGAPVGAGGRACRKVELATGAMIEYTPGPPEPALPQPTATIEGGELVACTGVDSCKRAPPEPGIAFVRAAIGGDQGKVAAVTRAGERWGVVVFDQSLAPVARLAIGEPVRDLAWLSGRVYVTTTAGAAVHGALYADDGTLRGWIGGDDAPLDLGSVSPVSVRDTRYAWLAADASAIAIHDARRQVRSRTDLEVTGAGRDLAALGVMPQGWLVVVLGGARFGDIVLIEPGDGEIRQLAAPRCPADADG